MHYSTIILELLQDRPAFHRSLQADKTLLPTIYRYASELKASHEEWKGRITRAKPDSDASQIASEALEFALKDLESRLPSESDHAESETLSLEEAMAFLRRHTPPA